MRSTVILLAAAAACALGVVALDVADIRAASGDPVGAQDFVAYWSAWDVTTQGEDPYDEADLAVAQEPLGLRSLEEPQRYWNPPWTLVFLAPVVSLPFETAARVWLVLSLAAAGGMAALGWRLLRAGPLPPLAFAGLLLFVPLLEGVMLGQLSAVMGVVVLASLVCIRERRVIAGGVLLAAVAVKPQSFLVLLAVLGVHLVAERRWRTIGAAVATFGALVVASVVVLPSAWAGWEPVGGAPTHWRTPTVASWIRSWVSGAPTWPLLVVPVAAGAAAVAWYLWRRRSGAWWSAVPVLLAASVLCAPFAWASTPLRSRSSPC